jgi:hypothetical protein
LVPTGKHDAQCFFIGTSRRFYVFNQYADFLGDKINGLLLAGCSWFPFFSYKDKTFSGSAGVDALADWDSDLLTTVVGVVQEENNPKTSARLKTIVNLFFINTLP